VGCSKPVCGICSNFKGDDAYCDACMNFAEMSGRMETKSKPVSKGGGRRDEEMEKLLAEEIPDTSGGLSRRGETPDKSEKVQMGIVIVCCLFIAFQISNSLRTGNLSVQEVAAETQRQNNIESCVAKFWEVAALLQEDRLPTDRHNCTDTNLPLVVSEVNGDVIVRHPSPQNLGLSEIVVRKSNPVPELIR
jgi:hypothetical protein